MTTIPQQVLMTSYDQKNRTQLQLPLLTSTEERPSLPFLLASVLDASWGSSGSFGSGTSFLTTDKGNGSHFRGQHGLKRVC